MLLLNNAGTLQVTIAPKELASVVNALFGCTRDTTRDALRPCSLVVARHAVVTVTQYDANSCKTVISAEHLYGSIRLRNQMLRFLSRVELVA